jgi:hypothetical protein
VKNVHLCLQITRAGLLTNLLRSFYPCSLVVFFFILSTQAACAGPVITPAWDICDTQLTPTVITSPQLSVLTLHLALGRKDSFNRMFQKTSDIHRNLDDIATFISDSGADIVAFQEAGSPRGGRGV